jgi:hypothetical protein
MYAAGEHFSFHNDEDLRRSISAWPSPFKKLAYW